MLVSVGNQYKNCTLNCTFSEPSKLIDANHVWIYGIATSIVFLFLSLVLTSFIVCCFKFKIKKAFLLNLIFALVSLAIGSLFGDSVIHILPEIFNPETEEDEESPNRIITSGLIISGFLVFFFIEKIFTLTNSNHTHAEDFDKESCHRNFNEKPDIREGINLF